MRYDFNTARKRREKLVGMYRALKRQNEEEGTWAWWIMAQIDEIDREIEEAHWSQDGKMTTIASNGHPVMQLENILTPIVPAWGTESRG